MKATKEPEKGYKLGGPAWVWLVAAPIAVFACVVGFSRDGPLNRGPPGYILGDPVPRIDVSGDKDFIQRVVARGVPVILRGSPIDAWPARKWTPEQVGEGLGSLHGVKMYEGQVFRYYESKAVFDDVESLRAQPEYKSIQMRGSELIKAMTDGDHTAHYYYSGVLNGQLLRDVQPWEYLRVDTTSDNKINIWVGEENVTASTHYDTSHNFYAQLVGRKRFLLFPPDTQAKMYLFPRPHAGYRQAQVDVDFPISQAYPNFAMVKGTEAILGPGDLLYLPPFWFHHVTSLSTSISVNVWTESDYQNTVNVAFKAGIPFEESWSPLQLRIAAKVYLDMLIENLYNEPGSAFVKRLLRERYYSLTPHAQWEAARRAHLCDPTESKLIGEAQLRQSMKARSDELVALFAKLPVGVREINVGNYVEHLSLFATSTEELFPFMLSCFLA